MTVHTRPIRELVIEILSERFPRATYYEIEEATVEILEMILSQLQDELSQ